MDEFEGGYDPNTLYGRSMENVTVRQVDLWGIIAGDRTWRKSALALSVILKNLLRNTTNNLYIGEGKRRK